MQCSILVVVLSLNFIFAALPKDICDICVKKESCDFFVNLNAQYKQAWMEKLQCQPTSDEEYRILSDYGPTGKGDFVCCPTNMWGTVNIPTEQMETKQDAKIHRDGENDNIFPKNNYNNSPQNQDANNQQTESSDRETYGSNDINANKLPNRNPNSNFNKDYQDVGIFNINNDMYSPEPSPRPTYRPPFRNINLEFGQTKTPVNNNPDNINLFLPNFNGNINQGQCAITSLPPSTETECCGREASYDDRIIVTSASPPLNGFIAPYNETTLDFQQDMPGLLTWMSQNILGSNKQDGRDETINTTVGSTAGWKETELHQFPWTVILNTTHNYTDYQASFSCGGSLISSRYVLTAGHCIYDEAGIIARIEVYLAEYDKRTFPIDCKKVFGIGQICVQNIVMYAEQAILHPQYEESTLLNDIALIRLRNYAPNTEYIRPICLPPFDIIMEQFSRLPLSIVGWGRNGTVQSDVKKSTVVKLIPREQCVNYYPLLSRSQMCAAGYSGEDTRNGDSGGPLMTVYRGKYVIVGVVSGKREDSILGSSVPALYTSVFPYLDWIWKYMTI